MRILAGDIGGTNTRIRVFARDARADARLVPIGSPIRFKNSEFDDFAEIINEAKSKVGAVTDACFGIAGPVEDRLVEVTNIPRWPVISADAIADQLGIAERHRVSLINDLEAHAASIVTIERESADHVVTLHVGNTRPTGAKLVVMPGTGLGIGLLIFDRASGLHFPAPTEAGYADISFRDESTRAVVASLQTLLADERVNREHLVSGPGVRTIYACLKDPERPDLSATPTAESIVATEASDPIARRTLDLFAQMLAELCGNAAFQYLATGGIYLAGSVANSLRSRLDNADFRRTVWQTGPAAMHQFISSIPLRLIAFEGTGLLGAATYAALSSTRRA